MAKKAAVKKVTEAAPEKSFWLCDGRVLRSLKDLAGELEKMDDLTWKYHVTSQKNDFANWVEGVFGEKKLGTALRAIKNPKMAAKKIKASVQGTKLWSIF